MSTCSIHSDANESEEGPTASNRFLTVREHGPFTTPFDYFDSIAESHLEMIADGQLHPEYPKEAFLFWRLLRARAAPALAEASTVVDSFFLKHVDDKGDHIFIDEEHNITAIIDWQFARFVPASEAFGPSLFTADMGMIYDGSPGLTDNDELLAACLKKKGRDDLLQIAFGNELVRRFHFELASRLSKGEVLGMIGAVLSLLCGELELSKKAVREWMEKEWTLADDDPRKDKVVKLLEELDEHDCEV